MFQYIPATIQNMLNTFLLVTVIIESRIISHQERQTQPGLFFMTIAMLVVQGISLRKNITIQTGELITVDRPTVHA